MKHSGSSTGIFCWIFIFLSAVCTIKAESVADSLYAKGDYLKAALEYEYLYYISSEPADRALCLIKKSECFSKTGDHRRSTDELDRIDVSGLNDSLQLDIQKRLSFSSYLAGSFEKAESHLLRYEVLTSDSFQIVSMLPLATLVLNELHRWNEAAFKMSVYVKKSYHGQMKDSLLKIIETSYDEGNLPRLKNLKRAQTMSAFVPGLGQMYSGYVLDGLTSSFLVLGSVAFTVYSVVTAHYITAAVIGYGLMSKFYMGGITHLEYLVGKTNYERSKKFNEGLKSEIVKMVRVGDD